MQTIRATMIADSLINGVRVSTVEMIFPRFILAELNTHRVFSRNSASSRARSVKRTFAEVMEAPFVPAPFTRNMKGMSGCTLDPEDQVGCESYWLRARDAAVLSALDLMVGEEKRTDLIGDDVTKFLDVLDAYDMEADTPSVHKQHVNRILEPYMYHTAIVSSTEWDNFFELRIEAAAQPEMYELAVAVKETYDASQPVERDIHLPYHEGEDSITAFDVKRSVASCATVSYKAPSELNDAAVERIYSGMFADKHMSPFEHQAIHPAKLDELAPLMGWELPENVDECDLHGNFRPGVVQLRKVLELL